MMGELMKTIEEIQVEITQQRADAEEARHAQEVAEAANRAKSVFLANMSHDIRTPMNAILGFSHLLLRDVELTSQQKQHVSIIMRSGEQLLALINDILEKSKIEAGRVHLHEAPLDVQELFNELEKLYRQRAEAKHLRFTVERFGNIPQHVVADEEKLRQVFGKLLGNAIKFTETGGVTLRVRITGGDNPSVIRLHAEVEDTGVGISQEERERVFQSFEQTQSERKIGGGTGLGLAISREFIRLMGGEIAVRSKPDQGSIFSFEIVLKKLEGIDQTEAKEVPREVRSLCPESLPCRVLVADDREENRILLSQMLCRVGFEVCDAIDGAEALDQFELWRPDLILIDMNMPVMDGTEAVRRIRATKTGSDVKIICISGNTAEEAHREATAAGADGFLNKPFRDTELFETIRTQLGVEYVYEDPASDVFGSDECMEEKLTPGSILQLPEDLLARMRDAVVAADFYRVMELITTIPPQEASLARGLRHLAEHFDSKRLLQIIPPSRKGDIE